MIEGLAFRIANRQAPGLEGFILFELDPNSLTAGTMYRGQLEERYQSLTKAIENKKIILVIDEIHRIFGTRSMGGGDDFSQHLKPPIARGEVTVIGITTTEEWMAGPGRDQAFDRRFQKLRLGELSVGEFVTGYAEIRNEEDLVNHIWGLKSIPNIHTDLKIGDYRKSDLFLAAINRVVIPTGSDFKSSNIDEFGREYNIDDGYKLFYIDTSKYPVLYFYGHLVDFEEVHIRINYGGQQIDELLEEFVESLRIACGDIEECNILLEEERVIPLLETKEEMVEYVKRYIVYKVENLDFGF